MAHAAGRDDAWWWPVEEDTEGVFWPDGVDREPSLECFIEAFRTLGYAPCDNADLEAGFEKIALFVDADEIPSHAARQLPSGAWTSKLGEWEDIEHNTLGKLEGAEAYGKAICFLKRPSGQSAGPAPPIQDP